MAKTTQDGNILKLHFLSIKNILKDKLVLVMIWGYTCGIVLESTVVLSCKLKFDRSQWRLFFIAIGRILQITKILITI